MPRTPLCPSLITVACALAIHPWSGQPISRPVSFELQSGNVLAFMTLVGLAFVLLCVARRFWAGRNLLSSATCVLCVALLTVIPLTEPNSPPHDLAFGALVVLATGLFIVWAADTYDPMQMFPPLLPVAFGAYFHQAIGTGGLQLILIGSLLLALNLTFLHLERRDSL